MASVVWVVLFIGCQQHFENNNKFVPENGDLLFQESDCGPFCDAIKKVTTGYRGAKFTHVGVAAKDEDGNLVVIEAKSKGVVITPLQDYLGKSLDVNGQPKVVVGRLKKQYQHLIPCAIKEGKALEGRPYDKVFAINNDRYYCSELIYEIFLRANNNVPIFELQPMTFNDPATGNIFPVWKDYFNKLGVAVPEGEPGINPGGISRSPAIEIIHAYGRPDGWKEEFD